VPTLDIIRAQDVSETSGQSGQTILKFANAEGRVVVTRDISTIVPAMREPIRIESRCAPIVLVPDSLPIGTVIEDLLIFDRCASDGDWSAGVIYIPLR
jgi:hypothetical protein